MAEPTHIESHLSRHQPTLALTEGELLAMKAKAWRDYELLLVSPKQLANPIDRQMVRSLGERLYGKRADG